MNENRFRVNGRIVRAGTSWKGESLRSQKEAQETADQYNRIFDGEIVYSIEEVLSDDRNPGRANKEV